ncbi:MAG: hypothetical protein KBT03_11160 [Bacteroidales bacterium]|nr:hypothetical protein [Candidatus Scybalousia scybalohippi]
MELKLVRLYKKEDYTIGRLYINGVYICDTLEDKVRVLKSIKDKVYGKTAIPYGRYEITMNVRSEKYLKKAKSDSYYSTFCGFMPRFINVPFFDAILIHPGSTSEDSLGCILVGYNKEKGKLSNSREAFSNVWSRLNNASKAGEQIVISITD